MPCAAGELCIIPGLTPEPPHGRACRGGCGGRVHGLCGEVEEPDGDNLMRRIRHACAVAKVLHEGGRDSPRGQAQKYRQGGPWDGYVYSAKSNAGKTDGSTSRARLTLDQKLEILHPLG